MSKRNGGDAVVRRFFAYRGIRTRPSWSMVAATLVVAVVLFTAAGEARGNDQELLAASGVFVLVIGGAVAGLQRWLGRRSKRELGSLAVQARRQQASDAVAALLRIFRRTHLDLADLRTFDEVFEKERDLLQTDGDLFREDRPDATLKEIFNKSIRMWSQGQSKSTRRFRRVAWADGRLEDFYNPIRVVALFLNAEELVICDSEVDSLDGDRKENIVRVMVGDIVSVSFGSERTRFNLPNDEIVRLAEQSRFSRKQLAELRYDLAHRDKRDPRYVQEEITAWLAITRTDSEALQFPIQKYLWIGECQAAGAGLTRDEETIDRMMNELNRIVRGARQRRGA